MLEVEVVFIKVVDELVEFFVELLLLVDLAVEVIVLFDDEDLAVVVVELLEDEGLTVVVEELLEEDLAVVMRVLLERVLSVEC